MTLLSILADLWSLDSLDSSSNFQLFHPHFQPLEENPAIVLENDTYKPQWDFDIHTDHLISARRPGLIVINNKKKRTFKIVDFAVSANNRIKLKKKGKEG